MHQLNPPGFSPFTISASVLELSVGIFGVAAAFTSSCRVDDKFLLRFGSSRRARLVVFVNEVGGGPKKSVVKQSSATQCVSVVGLWVVTMIARSKKFGQTHDQLWPKTKRPHHVFEAPQGTQEYRAPKCKALKGGALRARKVERPKISRFFSLPQFFVFLPSFRGIRGVLKRRALKCARLEFLSCRVKPRRSLHKS